MSLVISDAVHLAHLRQALVFYAIPGYRRDGAGTHSEQILRHILAATTEALSVPTSSAVSQSLQPTATHSDDDLVTIAEAARRAHVSRRTIERRLYDGRLTATTDDKGRRWVHMKELSQ